jgi:hypothetical protein
MAKSSKKVAKKPASPARKPAAKREPARPVEHRVAVASVGIGVGFGPGRVEQFELRGAAIANASLPEGGTRTSGLVRIVRRKGAKGDSTIAYDPASLMAPLVITLLLDEEDFALFRDVFVRNPGAYDPSMRVWARTAAPLDVVKGSTAKPVQHGYNVDLVHAPGGQR